MRHYILYAVVAALMIVVGGRDATAQTVFFSESFDAVSEPDFSDSVLSFDASWKTNSSSSSPGSGANNAVHTGSGPGALIIGPVDLTAALDGTISYWARRTSSYAADSLIVRAGFDGVLFDLDVFGGGLPAVASSWEEIAVPVPDTLLGSASVYLLFNGRGGTSSGSNIRIDDILVAGTADPGLIPSAFGFESESATWLQSDSVFSVELDLSWPGPDTLQGIQFDLDFDESMVLVDSVLLGPDLLGTWSSSWEASVGTIRVAAVDLSPDGLPPGPHSDVLHVYMSATSPVASDTTFTLGLSGILAVSTSAAADEILLPGGTRSLGITLSPAAASISLSSLALDFGTVVAGNSAEVSLDISNPTGSTSLVFSGFAFESSLASDSLSAVLPDSVDVGSLASGLFRIHPDITSVGQLSGTLTLYHNAPGDSIVVDWTALALGGRGDADADGVFDVADVVASLDASVSFTPPDAEVLHRHDLFPFPSGDGAVDVRDVTLAIQAILRNQWPDGSPLPVAPSSVPGSPSSGSLADAGVFKSDAFRLVKSNYGLFVEAPVALRGIQLEFRLGSPISFQQPTKTGASLSTFIDAGSDVHRVLLLARADTPFDAGHLILSGIAPTEMELISGIVVDTDGAKHDVVAEPASLTDLDLQLPSELITVYPNPLPLGQRLQIAATAGQVQRIEVFDAIGRKLYSSSNMVVFVPADVFRVPGFYYVRLTEIEKATTISIIAAR